MDREQLMSWFVSEVVPELVAAGCLSDGDGSLPVRLQSWRFEDFESGRVNFASIPSFIELVLEAADGTSSTRHLFVKFQVQDPAIREKMKTVIQFQNESTFYNHVASEFRRFLASRSPELSRVISEGLPRCFYARQPEEAPEKGLVVLENAAKSGFRLSPSEVDLDEDHCKVAVVLLARFHATSLAMKLLQWPAFPRLKMAAEPVWAVDEPDTRQLCQHFKGFCARRGIDHLERMEGSPVPQQYLEILRRKLDDTFGLIQEANVPEEPLAVICHGDFNRNNLLFAYEGGRPVRAKLLDFQTFVYGSPSLDLTFFFYMNTTLSFRENHFDDLFRLYHSTLLATTCALATTHEPTVASRFPLSAFQEDFERRAMNAYVTVSFFLPVMMAPADAPFDAIKENSLQEMAEDNYRRGGQPVTERIADVLLDFYNRRFFVSKQQPTA